MTLTLESPAYENGEMIPPKYTCDGTSISPPVVVKYTESYAIIFDDPDAPAKTWVHWVLYNIPADQKKLKENIADDKKLPNGAIHGINDFRKYGYGGPCPPSGIHRYFMKLYALDSTLDLDPGASKQELLDAIEGHIIEQAELMGRYQRQ